jgi:hypothetical protein
MVEWSEYYPFPFVMSEAQMRAEPDRFQGDDWDCSDTPEQQRHKAEAHFAAHSVELTDAEAQVVADFEAAFGKVLALFRAKNT